MTTREVRKKYLDFFTGLGHTVVPSVTLIPANDSTTLFTSAGMQPMVPYLLGQTHPAGKRLVNSQRCFRAQDIDEVADRWHLTFFEMLGNWSLGDYWKTDQLSWFFEFLTEKVGLDSTRLFVTAFGGDQDNNLPRDEESAQIWQDLFARQGIRAEVVEIGSVACGNQHGIKAGRIFYYDCSKNWWSRSGSPNDMPPGEPGGPDSEVFYDTQTEHDRKFGPYCHPNCGCGRFVEIGNSVFMEYLKQTDGTFAALPHKNVDFGGGLERIAAVSQNLDSIFESDSFWPVIEKACEQLGVSYQDNGQTRRNLRIIADHIRAATFLIKDGVLPANKLQGYVLRRLLRRAAIKSHQLTENSMEILPKLVDPVLDIYQDTGYFAVGDWDRIRQVIEDEVGRFRKTLRQGLKQIEKWEKIDGQTAFNLYQSFGFPIELTQEIVRERGQEVDMNRYGQEVEKHRRLSQTTSAGMFKGGLADHSEATTKLHTVTHMLQAATKQVLGREVGQRGSRITANRLRWDFNYPHQLTADQIRQLEEVVNDKIRKDLSVWFEIKDRDRAIAAGATVNQGESYPNKVKVYKIGQSSGLFSQELCAGPHVKRTGTLGGFKIIKEVAVSSGIRRIYAELK